jgi:hypothetical protein
MIDAARHNKKVEVLTRTNHISSLPFQVLSKGRQNSASRFEHTINQALPSHLRPVTGQNPFVAETSPLRFDFAFQPISRSSPFWEPPAWPHQSHLFQRTVSLQGSPAKMVGPMHAKCSPCFPSRSSLESWRNDCRYLSPKVSDLPLLPCAECRFATLKSVDLWIRIESLIRIHIRSSVGPIRKNRNRILKRIFGDSEMDRVVTAVVAVFQNIEGCPSVWKKHVWFSNFTEVAEPNAWIPALHSLELF